VPDANQPAVTPTGVGFLFPAPDESAIEGLTPMTAPECMTSALLEAMGSHGNNTGCTNTSSNNVNNMQQLQEYTEAQRSSNSLRLGMINKSGSSFCVNHQGPDKAAGRYNMSLTCHRCHWTAGAGPVMACAAM
jgi:hypothetical protein